MNVTGTGGRYIIERKAHRRGRDIRAQTRRALPPLRDVLENHRLEIENGVPRTIWPGGSRTSSPASMWHAYGFQQFAEFLNYAQDKTVVRLEPDEEQGTVLVYLGAEFYPPAEPPQAEPEAVVEEEIEEEDEPQPYVEGQPTIFEPNPPPAKAKRAPSRKRISKPHGGAGGGTARRPPRRKKTDK